MRGLENQIETDRRIIQQKILAEEEAEENRCWS